MTALLFKARMKETVQTTEPAEREDGRTIFLVDHAYLLQCSIKHNRRKMVNGELNNRHPSRMIGGI
jgi:hypothetical protein